MVESRRHGAASRRSQVAASVATSSAVDQVQQRRLAAGVQPAAWQRRRRRRRCNSRCPNMYIVVPINPSNGPSVSASTCRSASRPSRTTAGSAATRASSRRSRRINVNPALSWKITRSFSVGVGVNYQQIKATLTRTPTTRVRLLQAAQTAAAGGLDHAGAAAAFTVATPGLDSIGQHRRQRLGLGLEHRRAVEHHARHCASARATARRSSTTSTATSISTTRRCRRCRRRSRRSAPRSSPAVNSAARERRRDLRYQAAGDRQPVVLYAGSTRSGN